MSGPSSIGRLLSSPLAYFKGLIRNARQRRDAAQRSEDRFRLALEGGRDAIWDWDMRRNKIWFSPGWQKIIDFSDAQMRAYDWASEVHPEELDEAQAQLRAHYSGELEHFQLIYRHRYGDLTNNDGPQWKWIEARGECQRDANGRAIRFTGHLRDIDQQVRAEQALRNSEQRMVEAQRIARFGGWSWDIRHWRMHWSAQARQLLGVAEDAAPSPELLLQLAHPDDRQHVLEMRRQVFEEDREYNLEFRLQLDDGNIRWLHSIARADYDHRGQVTHLAGVLQDVTARREAEDALRRSERRLRDAIEALQEGFVLWDAEDRLVMCNTRHRELYAGLNDLLVPGVHFEALLQAALERRLVMIQEPQNDWLARRRQLHREGGSVDLQQSDGRWIQLTERRTAEGGVVGVGNDITELRHTTAEVQRLAYYDDLTGLPNRALFRRQLLDASRQAKRREQLMALMFLDLDRFKNLNDSLGHAAGDQLLCGAAQRLRGALRDSDIVARLGGDEFTILVQNLESPDNATRLAEQLLEVLGEPYQINDHQVHAEASIGITLCPDYGLAPDTLLRQADMAMYAAKANGRNTLAYFTPELTAKAQRFMYLEGELRKALAQGQLAVYYQPAIDLHSGHIAGAEALVRWHDANGALHDTEELVSVAEETGLIDELGKQVINQALAESRHWHDGRGKPLHIALNVSGRQFRSGFGRERIIDLLAEHDFPAQRLILEITESTFLDQGEATLQSLQGLRDLGLRLSLDDFGTGYSALGYLRRYPVDILKIDRSFVAALGEDRSHGALVEAIVAMAHSLHLRVVAEGIETPEQAEQLATMGCTWGQGFHYAQALPATEFEALLDHWKSA